MWRWRQFTGAVMLLRYKSHLKIKIHINSTTITNSSANTHSNTNTKVMVVRVFRSCNCSSAAINPTHKCTIASLDHFTVYGRASYYWAYVKALLDVKFTSQTWTPQSQLTFYMGCKGRSVKNKEKCGYQHRNGKEIDNSSETMFEKSNVHGIFIDYYLVPREMFMDWRYIYVSSQKEMLRK